MKRSDVRSRVEDFLAELGVPSHCVSVRAVKPSTEVRVLIAGQPHIIRARSGITKMELEAELARVSQLHKQRALEGQTDLEDFTGWPGGELVVRS